MMLIISPMNSEKSMMNSVRSDLKCIMNNFSVSFMCIFFNDIILHINWKVILI